MLKPNSEKNNTSKINKRNPSYRTLFILFTLFFFYGCSAPRPVTFIMPDTDISKLKTFYVVMHEEDTGDINKAIADAIINLNLKASTGPKSTTPDGTNVVVTYEYHWWWDMGSFLQNLTIYFRNPSNDSIIAKGSASRESFNRQTKEEIANEIIESIFNNNKIR